MSSQLPTATDVAMMELTLAEAHRAISCGSIGVAALISWRDQVLAIAHCTYQETGDHTAHAELVALQQAAQSLRQISPVAKAELTLYTTLEPCLMCLAATSFAGLKRVVYAALAADSDGEGVVAEGITTELINPLLVRGPLQLLPGVKRQEGRELLRLMGKAST